MIAPPSAKKPEKCRLKNAALRRQRKAAGQSGLTQSFGLPWAFILLLA
jgi:hypothetical protein